MEQSQEQALRQHVLHLLRGGRAHLDFDSLVADLTPHFVNKRLPGLPYTLWHLLEHMRIAQWDILEFSRNPLHQSPAFPDGYWPDRTSNADAAQLENTLSQFRAGLLSLQGLVADPDVNLFASIPHGDGQTVLREALVLADHNAYHLGALAVMKRLVEGKAKDET
jgi:hypothetical protein